jgi:Uma2 family endonuclease
MIPEHAPVEEATPVTTVTEQVPKLHNGDRLTREEFERRYAAMPEVKKAELIEGVVYMPSPDSNDHSEPHFHLVGWLAFYKAFTPGIAGGDNGTVRLDMDNDPQPDGFLRILERHGGQAHVDGDGYVTHAPELVAAVAATSVSIDLHDKSRVYRRNGVKEYVVWRVEDREIDWFVLRGTQFECLPRTVTGLYRSEVFPGLWLDPDALFRGDLPAVFDVLRQGVASPEHASFVAALEERAARARP